MSCHIFLLVLFHSLHVLPWLDHFILLRSWVIHHVRLELLVLLTFLDHLSAPWSFLAFLEKSHVQLKKMSHNLNTYLVLGILVYAT